MKKDSRVNVMSHLRANGNITVTIRLRNFPPDELAGLAKRMHHGHGKGIEVQRQIGAVLEREIVDLYLQESKS
jgi:hypothetical protein